MSYILTFVMAILLFAFLAPSDTPVASTKLIIGGFGIFIIAPLLISFVLAHNHPFWFIVSLAVYSIPVLLFILGQSNKTRKLGYFFFGLSGFVSAVICGGASFILMNG